MSLPLPRKGVEEPELVYAHEANEKIAQMVIKFYESKLTWHEAPEDSESTEIFLRGALIQKF